MYIAPYQQKLITAILYNNNETNVITEKRMTITYLCKTCDNSETLLQGNSVHTCGTVQTLPFTFTRPAKIMSSLPRRDATAPQNQLYFKATPNLDPAPSSRSQNPPTWRVIHIETMEEDLCPKMCTVKRAASRIPAFNIIHPYTMPVKHELRGNTHLRQPPTPYSTSRTQPGKSRYKTYAPLWSTWAPRRFSSRPH